MEQKKHLTNLGQRRKQYRLILDLHRKEEEGEGGGEGGSDSTGTAEIWNKPNYSNVY